MEVMSQVEGLKEFVRSSMVINHQLSIWATHFLNIQPRCYNHSWGLLSDFSMESKNNNKLLLSHLLFANDTLIIYEANTNHLRHLYGLFLCFEAIWRLKINLAKSKLVNVSAMEDVGGLARILGCKVSSIPILGLPLGYSFKPRSIWDGIIEKMERRLAGCKRLYLSKGGRITLIQSTLSNLPTYFCPSSPFSWCGQSYWETLAGFFVGTTWWGV